MGKLIVDSFKIGRYFGMRHDSGLLSVDDMTKAHPARDHFGFLSLRLNYKEVGSQSACRSITD